jgi:hypothetical protein
MAEHSPTDFGNNIENKLRKVQYDPVVYREGARLVIMLIYGGYVMSEMSRATLHLTRNISSDSLKCTARYQGCDQVQTEGL